jgi:predicted transposase/invertase (TIGR01784 family)
MSQDIYDRLFKKLKKNETEEEKLLKMNNVDSKRYQELVENRIEHNGAVSYALIKRFEKGKEEGLIEMQKLIVKKMLDANVDIKIISKWTGLKEEEI